MSRRILWNVDRGQTRETGARNLATMKSGSFLVIDALPVFVKNDLSDGQGSWTDETHIATQDADNLRQFVQAAGAQNAAHARNTMIVHHRLFQPIFFIGVRNHCAEFENHELLSEPPPPLLPVKDRAAVFDLDGDGD